MPIKQLEAPKVLHIPLTTYKGSLTPLVTVGSYVKKHQQLATSSGIFASTIHAPVSGTIKDVLTINNQQYLVLENNFKDDVLELPQIAINNLTPTHMLHILKEYGIEGSGGAKFPTHTKYNTSNQTIDTFIINAAECEPYLSADYALVNNNIQELLQAISLMQKVINAKQIVFGIEKQHKELKAIIAKEAAKQNIPVFVKIVPNEYPQGGELQLIKSVTGKELPKGSIPANHGIIVSNIGTLWAIYNAFYHNIPYTKRIITISGENAATIGNYEVHIGTPVWYILAQTGLAWDTTKQTIILGGPMMGKAVLNPEVSITKGSGGMLVMPNPTNKRYNCIQCGYCADVCPQHLMPMEFARYATKNNKPKLQEYRLTDCIECGACAYICPSDVPLMSSIFNGKQLFNTQ